MNAADPVNPVNHDEPVTDAELDALFQDEARQALHNARVPAAGQVWWRAAVRAHTEATHAAARPMVWLQGIAGACVVGLGAALMGFAWPSLERGARHIGALAASVEAIARTNLALTLVLLACLVVAPLALYLVLSDE